ncbi:hypothetical protein BDV96DRAFT_500756 [Lophiotrema nucula]|uniref:UBC core domain-containing protein n=1 Tax=Lophiotrema nucula TaxID=690887 RepID=A0A6A5YUW7_9PLEO|nr:hypothetical protein BDV96DRAFT_500756 [Lophiotrema nucula]
MPLPDSSPTLSSFRKQNLLVEFSSLKYAQLDGVFVSITPGDPTLWVGVIFVRKGPYTPAALRFQISFPTGYPTLPPLVTFSTDVFHPLLTPLTTYTYTTGSSDTSDTVSATDDERLPPGGFSLRHGFPRWFGRARKSAASSRNVSGSGVGSPAGSATPVYSEPKSSTLEGFGVHSTATSTGESPTIIQVLEYIRSTFSDEAVLDSIPLAAAANPSAYHAWRTYRGEALPSPTSSTSDAQAGTSGRTADASVVGRRRRPGEWNWEGVWEDRVRKAVKASVSEPVLFGGLTAGEDIIRFRDGDEESMQKMKSQMEGAIARSAEL